MTYPVACRLGATEIEHQERIALGGKPYQATALKDLTQGSVAPGEACLPPMSN